MSHQYSLKKICLYTNNNPGELGLPQRDSLRLLTNEGQKVARSPLDLIWKKVLYKKYKILTNSGLKSTSTAKTFTRTLRNFFEI